MVGGLAHGAASVKKLFIQTLQPNMAAQSPSSHKNAGPGEEFRAGAVPDVRDWAAEPPGEDYASGLVSGATL